MPTPVRQLLWLVLVAALVACSAESVLYSLQKDFPQRKGELNELKDLMLSLSDSAGDFRYLSSTDMLDFFDNLPRIPISDALNSRFPNHKADLLKVQRIVHDVGIAYVSVEKTSRTVWVTMEGGGVLGADKGYLYAGQKNISTYRLDHVIPIPGESSWYAFFD
jgi:hypothetical protein